jgi:hypothetical protein
MILDATTKSIQVLLGEGISSSNLDVTASWGDYAPSGFLPGANDAATNGVTPVAIVAAPSAGIQRLVSEITVHNNDTIAHTVILQLLDSVTTRTFRSQSVASGADFNYAPTLPASSVVLVPTPAVGNELNFIRVNSAGTAYEAQTPAQTLGDIAGGVSGAINNVVIGGGTPAAGSFTTVSASSTITPNQTAGIVGTTTNNAANAGSVGEVISSTVLVGSAVTLSNATPLNITSIALSAGDWDVYGEVWISVGTGGATILLGSINTVSNTLAVVSSIGTSRTAIQSAQTASLTAVFALKPCQASLSGSQTYYLVAQAAFPSGTTVAYGNIWARRAR